MISVVIPAYRATHTLQRAVASLEAQDEIGEVLIVVNSNDETYEEAKRLAIIYPDIPIRVIAPLPEVLPVAENWTRACNEAKCDYIKLLCADDALVPGALKLQLAAMEENPEIVLCGGLRDIYLKDDRPIIRRRGGTLLPSTFDYMDLFRSICFTGGNSIGEPTSVLLRKTVLKEHLPWRSEFPFAIDLDMYLRMLKDGGVGILIDQTVAKFFISESSWSTTMARTQSRDLVKYIGSIQIEPLVAKVFYRTSIKFSSYFASKARQLVYKFN